MASSRYPDSRRKSRRIPTSALALLISALLQTDSSAQVKASGGLEAKPFASLSDSNITQLGRTALEVRKDDWKHAETENFIYHYFENFIATPVSIEAEFHYKYVARELKKDTTKWERKSHIFIFDSAEDWGKFRSTGGLDPWTGGLQSNNELFIIRDATHKWKGHTLAHEVTHLVLFRFYGGGIPLWLNEGYSENVGVRSYASFYRARGYQARPWSRSINEKTYVSVGELTGRVDYPENSDVIVAFYTESEKLVRYLFGADRAAFLKFIDDMSAGALFHTALARHYGVRWTTKESFEREFKSFALGSASATDSLK
jgi:hypothetical protein